MPDPDQDDQQQAFQERLDRIADLFSGIVSHAEVSSRTRCPYRDRHDRCTALFRCRNQIATDTDPDVLTCGHDGTFDYRTAWETNARARQRTSAKITAIKEEAASRRRERTGEEPRP